MTPEEKAVIEAAEEAVKMSGWSIPLAEAVAALREARKPKPRWYVNNQNLCDRAAGCAVLAWSAEPVLLTRIARLLNQEDAGK